ncbi:peptidase MA family metallohydrolase [Mechercharimyces sp. CAU 1602]|uniref:peptidase MA family metallohydrolase n=1 Tax=Mechercharimyces sp. CAU 1602 TaxID=2973933 RepID=UPI002162AF50|nr:hypothetical protein [Mechercharimyces sp. CAU 1602]MCS1352099.1 hypothetical protein [Mechercharimyces sp. CAU 1602]
MSRLSWLKGFSLLLLILTLVMQITLDSSSVFASAEEMEHVRLEIENLLQEKEHGINERSFQRFKQVIDPENKTYLQEQKRWFQDAILTVDPGTYHLELLSIIPGDNLQLHTLIKQEYQSNGKIHTLKIPLLFKNVEGNWYESDIPFQHMAEGSVVVHYSHPDLKEQAAVALDAANKAFEAFAQKFGWEQTEKTEIKLYHDDILFRQSVKLSLPEWAAGWNEFGQSIKFVGQKGDTRSFSAGIVHEITHKVLSDLTTDNASYWLQEGAAEYYEAHLLPGMKSEHPVLEESQYTWEKLKEQQLELLGSADARAYYAHCYDFYRYLVERFGEKKLQEVFTYLKLYPLVDQDAANKLPETNERTEEALQKGLGVSLSQIGREWVEQVGNRQEPNAPMFQYF